LRRPSASDIVRALVSVNRAATAAVILAGLALAAGTAWILCTRLTQYPSHLPIGIAAGIGLALATALIARAIARSRWRGTGPCALAVLLVLALAACGSLAWGRITHARFGLTVYGVIPIPLLDLTVDSRGLLGFRDKTHLVTPAEIAALLGAGQGEVVIGIGWDSQVRLDPECERRFPGRLHVLPTPAAIERFHYLRYEGVRVVLLLHTTC